MNSTHNISKVYHGKWRIPTRNQSGEVEYKECMGTLTYDGENIKLVVYPEFSIAPCECEYIKVLYGQNNSGLSFTLFGLNLQNINFGVSASFIVGGVIVGREVESLSIPVYNECVVRYPYLMNWINRHFYTSTTKDGKAHFETQIDNLQPVCEFELEDGVTISLCPNPNCHWEGFQFNYTEDVELRIKSSTPKSIDDFQKIITKLSVFLSVALYGKQSPYSVKYGTNEDGEMVYDDALFQITKSKEPTRNTLIKFEQFKDRLGELVRKWFKDYEQIAPVSSYLISSLEKSVFDAPKFLIVAQAVDGYFKRFVNGKDGKNTKQYEHQIRKLLKQFHDVDAIKTCNIDAEELAHTRHKYSHLIPDTETQGIEKAVSGEDLLLLTKKTMVLLTCCILDYMGMTTNDINACIKGSIVERMI